MDHVRLSSMSLGLVLSLQGQGSRASLMEAEAPHGRLVPASRGPALPLESALPSALAPDPQPGSCPPALPSALTVRSLGRVELLDGVVEADADGGEAHLALQAGHQPVVGAAGALVAHHGENGAQHPAVLGAPGRLVLPLDLRDTPCSKELSGGGRGWTSDQRDRRVASQ